MKNIKLRLTLDVTIDPQSLTAKECKDYITRMINHGIANGLLTGDSDATVEHYNFKITTRRPKRKAKSNNAVYSSYPNELCPDCFHGIPKTVKDGESCLNCGHVFNVPKDDDDAAEQQRRDEKNGLFPDKEDIAN